MRLEHEDREEREPPGGAISVRLMRSEDLSFAESLRQAAGWNQTPQDWERFLRLSPKGCFVAELAGRPAATATTVVYDGALAWIGMLIVLPDFRGRGLGRALLGHCCEHLRKAGVGSIKLDATPAGKTLYEKMGFEEEWTLRRWEISEVPRNLPTTSDAVRKMENSDLGEVLSIDRETFGAARRDLLELLLAEKYGAFVRGKAGQIDGFAFLRPGSNAYYLGPATGWSSDASSECVVAALRLIPGRPLFWDIPDANNAAIALATQLGLKVQRQLTRMRLGSHCKPAKPASEKAQFAIAGPELG